MVPVLALDLGTGHVSGKIWWRCLTIPAVLMASQGNHVCWDFLFEEMKIRFFIWHLLPDVLIILTSPSLLLLSFINNFQESQDTSHFPAENVEIWSESVSESFWWMNDKSGIDVQDFDYGHDPIAAMGLTSVRYVGEAETPDTKTETGTTTS